MTSAISFKFSFSTVYTIKNWNLEHVTGRDTFAPRKDIFFLIGEPCVRRVILRLNRITPTSLSLVAPLSIRPFLISVIYSSPPLSPSMIASYLAVNLSSAALTAFAFSACELTI